MHSKEQIQLIAESLLPQFAPKQPEGNELSFHFTIPPKSSYKVTFKLSSKNEWVFEGFENDAV